MIGHLALFVAALVCTVAAALGFAPATSSESCRGTLVQSSSGATELATAVPRGRCVHLTTQKR